MNNQTNTSEDEVVINVEGKDFPCSRAKLCENSDYFNVMFNGNFTEKDKKYVTIQDVTEKAFQNCLLIIEQKIDSLEYDQILNTLQCACMLQFEKIKKDCIQRLTDDLRTEYCLDVWHMTEFLDIHPLCEHAKCRALMEFNRIKDTDSILQISLQQLHSYLANTLIYCNNEIDIFETGLKWWYENSSKLEETEGWIEKDTTQYLFAILCCIDFKTLTKTDVSNMSTYPDICDNKRIQSILKGIQTLMDDSTAKIDADIEKEVHDLFFKTKPRDRALLPCIISSEYPWEPDRTKRSRMERAINISYFDHNTKSMQKIFSHEFATKCSPTLNGSKVIPYKENLLLFGGENSYGSSNWNTNIWLYHSFKKQWQLITRMPKERRHFQACIVDDKLFIIGGTGKYRIKAHDEMMFYDFRKDKWCIDIHLPHSWLDVRACECENQLLILPAVIDNKYAYIFCMATYGWAKLTIDFPPNLKFNFKRNFVLFSKGNKVFLKGSHYLEMKVQSPYLKILSIEPTEELYGDKLNYYLNNNNLYLFTKHESIESDIDVIFQLHCFNIVTKKTELLVQINDSVDQWWHIKRGCFPYFHYSLTKDVHCISKYPL